jgi:uncharacterized membrane protein YidH (DUF202 family)
MRGIAVFIISLTLAAIAYGLARRAEERKEGREP